MLQGLAVDARYLIEPETTEVVAATRRLEECGEDGCGGTAHACKQQGGFDAMRARLGWDGGYGGVMSQYGRQQLSQHTTKHVTCRVAEAARWPHQVDMRSHSGHEGEHPEQDDEHPEHKT